MQRWEPPQTEYSEEAAKAKKAEATKDAKQKAKELLRSTDQAKGSNKLSQKPAEEMRPGFPSSGRADRFD